MAENTSKFTLVCFPCRQTAKATWLNAGKRRKCPNCGGQFANVGKHFNVPKRSDDKGWKSSEAFHLRNTRSMEQWVCDASHAMAKKWAARRHPPS
jgi:hypothetical protein